MYVCALSHSILLLLLHFDFFHVVELLFVVIEGLRLDGIPSCGCCAIEVLLECLISSLTILNQLIPSVLHH